MAELPIVGIGRKKYYIDERLKQIRNVKNPHDFKDLNDEEIADLKAKAEKQAPNRRVKVGIDDGEGVNIYSVAQKVLDSVESGADPDEIAKHGKLLYSVQVFRDNR
ncbi:Uncharacterised protein [uncultured archaeon]|nr:Uncharacterised protein [uncultured archaeon]